MKNLYQVLRDYCGSDHYPFHMPGHKRRLGALSDPFRFDITEIEGFDNLHHAEGILLEAQQRAAALYGSEETFFLVNGSTCGILSAIGACAPSGKLLMARNSHKAAYHGVFLNRLEAVYLYPEKREDGSNGPVSAEAVRKALETDGEIRAVFITSPTYDGVISDVREIAAAAHAYGVPLILDQAHGAHFGMHSCFPENGVRQGADLVIHSLHKTLPSLTQTALLHVNGTLVDRSRLKKQLGIFQSSSPSYVLMSSMDECIRILRERGPELFENFAEELKRFRKSVKDLKVLRIPDTDDPSKILIFAGDSGLTGLQLDQILRERYHLEMEMAAGSYVLALTSVGDDREGFDRLAEALHEVDRELAGNRKTGPAGDQKREETPEEEDGRREAANQKQAEGRREESGKPEICMSIWQAENSSMEQVRLEESGGRVAGEYVYLYPPGIPLVVPGERIGAGLLEKLLYYRRTGYSLQGMEDYSMRQIRVLCKTEKI